VTTPVERKPSVLIVDDTVDNLRLLGEILSAHGYETRAASSGAQALKSAEAEPPDLVLLDIMMPELGGYEVCRRLKDSPLTQDVPVLFMSALDGTQDKVEAFAAGGVDYVTKPYQIAEVLARVRTHIALRSLHAELQRANLELEERVAARTGELVRLNAALERFVPREFLEYLGKRDIGEVRLGDRIERDMTILFSDIRDSTARAERLDAHESFEFLNGFLRRVSPLIRQHRGFVDKYVGDGIMALFPERADDAVLAALGILAEVVRLNVELEARGDQPVQIGIGLHTGRVALGILGEEQRLQGTVISDAVNVASRISDLTKSYAAPLLVSGQTFDAIEDAERFRFKFLGAIPVKGKKRAVPVFASLGESGMLFPVSPPRTS
jgi:class 3 adenylate cyclase